MVANFVPSDAGSLSDPTAALAVAADLAAFLAAASTANTASSADLVC